MPSAVAYHPRLQPSPCQPRLPATSRQPLTAHASAQQPTVLKLQVVTANVVDFSAAPESFDRVVSVEMFEHCKNYQVGSRRGKCQGDPNAVFTPPLVKHACMHIWAQSGHICSPAHNLTAQTGHIIIVVRRLLPQVPHHMP